MNVIPIANNCIIVKSQDGKVLKINDDGDAISIQRLISEHHTATKIQGVFYHYVDHHGENKPDHIIDADIIRVTK